MAAAAEYEELPISLWARMALLKEARAVAHRKLCTTKKDDQYIWLGKPCTKEEYDWAVTDQARGQKGLPSLPGRPAVFDSE